MPTVTAKRTMYINGVIRKRGETFTLPQWKADQLTDKQIKVHKGFQNRQTKEQKPEYSYEQNGSWYTVYKGGEQVDKFQGKAKLSDYGLNADK